MHLIADFSQRCHSKQIQCVARPTKSARRRHSEALSCPISLSYSPQTNGQGQIDPSALPTFTATPGSGPSEFSVPPASVSYSGSGDIYETSMTSQADLTLDPFIPQRDMHAFSNLNSFPAFFEQVMLPSLEEDSFQGTQQPRVFDFMQDTDFTLADHDIFGTDFIPDLDRILDTTIPLAGFEDSQQSLLDDQESASRRAAAFQRSLWYGPLLSKLRGS